MHFVITTTNFSLVIVSLLFLVQTGFAQETSLMSLENPSFVSEANRWTYTHIYQVPNNKVDTVTFEAIFDGTVMVEDREYHEAYERIALNDESEWSSLGYYRQEGAKVYFWDEFSNKDILLYNFDMDSIGSTLSYSYGLNFTLELIRIDSISLKNGEIRERQTFKVLDQPGSEDTYWIEGIGSEDTPLMPSSLLDEIVDGANLKLECFFTNGEHLLQQNPSGQCAYLIVNVEGQTNTSKRIQVFPNPASRGASLFLNGDFDDLSSDVDISIFNVTGELVMQSKVKSRDVISIDHEMGSGLYYCIVQSGANAYYSNFIVVD